MRIAHGLRISLSSLEDAAFIITALALGSAAPVWLKVTPLCNIKPSRIIFSLLLSKGTQMS